MCYHSLLTAHYSCVSFPRCFHDLIGKPCQVTNNMYHLIQGVHEHIDVYKLLTSLEIWNERIVCKHNTTQHTLVLNNLPYILIPIFLGQHLSHEMGYESIRSIWCSCEHLHCDTNNHNMYLCIVNDRHMENA